LTCIRVFAGGDRRRRLATAISFTAKLMTIASFAADRIVYSLRLVGALIAATLITVLIDRRLRR